MSWRCDVQRLDCPPLEIFADSRARLTKVRFGDPTFLATVAYAPAAERLATVSLDGRVFVLSRNPEMVWQDVSIGHKKYPNARPFEMYAILEEVPEQLSLV